MRPTQVFSEGGQGPVGVNGFNPGFGAGTNAAVIFDSSNPTGGDFDLGSPNQDFGGPGIGADGEAGQPFQNDTALGKIIIVGENLTDANMDGFVDNPDDADVVGANLEFDFSALGSVEITSVTFIDGEPEEPQVQLDFYDSSDVLITSVMVLQPGDNGVTTETFDVVGVARLVINVNGSGGFDDICFNTFADCNDNGIPDDQDIEDGTSQDCNMNGIPDECEPDCDMDGTPDACEPDCDMDGTPDDCEEDCDDDGLPDDCEADDCDDDGIPDECEPDCDMDGLPDDCEVDDDMNGIPDDCEGGGEGCTPGYWKQEHHFDSWPAGIAPNQLFDVYFEDAFPGRTLVQVLNLGGGGLAALGRHTVSAFLNANSDGVDYDLTPQEVVDAFNTVFPGTTDDYEDLKDIFADFNEQGCPLN